MRKLIKLIMPALALLALGGTAVVASVDNCADDATEFPALAIRKLEGDGSETSSEPTEPTEPVTATGTVVIGEVKHGTIETDIQEGNVGDIVTITAKSDMFYVVDHVSVNGTALAEDEEITGKFVFALAEGENVITAKFAIDEELLGAFSTMVDQAMNKDWTSLFSVENVITIVSFILDGGILVAIARYFVKDKRLESKLEKWLKENMEKILPDSTKQTVLDTIERFITPYFSKIESEFVNLENALSAFSRCMALAQENTPEARIAITKELSSLKISDQLAISDVESRLREFMESQKAEMAQMIAQLNEIKETNTEVVAKAAQESIADKISEPEDEKAIPYE